MDRSTLGNFINMVKQQQGNNFDPEVAVKSMLGLNGQNITPQQAMQYAINSGKANPNQAAMFNQMQNK